MRNPGRLAVLLAAAAAGAVTQVNAQCRLCDTPTTSTDERGEGAPVELEIETHLNFDRLVMLGDGGGSAMLRPDGSTSAIGSLAQVSARAMVGSAIVRGEPNRFVRIELPRQIMLHSSTGAEISFDDVTSDLPAMPRLDSTGTLRFRFGGRLQITGDAEGDYRGDLPITADYL